MPIEAVMYLKHYDLNNKTSICNNTTNFSNQQTAK